jgi:hypothetical protein
MSKAPVASKNNAYPRPYHGVHHKYARLPHAVLPEFADDLEPGDPMERGPFPTYRHALVDMLPALLDPKVGSQWLSQRREGRADVACSPQGSYRELA